jgi:3-dehydroquinate dehydratase II
LDYAKIRNFELEIFYTNLEGEAINQIYRCADEAFDGLVMNPAGFSYSGYALKDCIKGSRAPLRGDPYFQRGEEKNPLRAL